MKRCPFWMIEMKCASPFFLWMDIKYVPVQVCSGGGWWLNSLAEREWYVRREPQRLDRNGKVEGRSVGTVVSSYLVSQVTTLPTAHSFTSPLPSNLLNPPFYHLIHPTRKKHKQDPYAPPRSFLRRMANPGWPSEPGSSCSSSSTMSLGVLVGTMPTSFLANFALESERVAMVEPWAPQPAAGPMQTVELFWGKTLIKKKLISLDSGM